MPGKTTLLKVQEYVIETFKKKGPNEKVYHGLDHTKNVAKACKVIGKASGLTDSELEIVQIAGWFHDLGHIETDVGHENKSADLAVKFLRKNQYPKEKIEKVVNCILATKVPQNPTNLLENVICDADLHHIGTKEFFSKNELFKIELETLLGKTFTESTWLRKSINFFTSQKFFTDYARKSFNEEKKNNILKMRNRLKKILKY